MLSKITHTHKKNPQTYNSTDRVPRPLRSMSVPQVVKFVEAQSKEEATGLGEELLINAQFQLG